MLSQFMHGEQGALVCTAKIVETVPWIDAKYYASTQVMDEARHVEVFAKYLDTKLSGHYPINAHLRLLLDDIVEDSRWDMTYLGMQIMVEGLALAAFGFMHQMTTEPLLKQLLRYVMSDEARHVAFGVLSLKEYYAELSDAEMLERQEFAFEAAVRMRDRFLQQEVWDRMGIDPKVAAGLVLQAPSGSSSRACSSPRSCRTARSSACSTRNDDWLRGKFTELGVIQFEDWADTGEEYEMFQLAEGEIARPDAFRLAGAQGRTGTVAPMSAPSDTRTLVLHGLRLKGFAEAAAVGEAVGRRRGRGQAGARPARRRRAARPTATASSPGFSLTKPGREEHARLLSPPSSTRPGARDAVEAAYQRFLELNTELLDVCTEWQLRDVDGESTVNDHSDARLRRRRSSSSWPRSTTGSSRSAPTSARALDRFGGYGPRLADALERVRHGRQRLVHQADDRQLPHGLVRDARGPAVHARHRARRRRRGLMANARFGRVLTAMVTPFDDDGSLDLDGAVALGALAGRPRQRRPGARRHHRRGPTLTDDEKVELWTRGARGGRRAARRRHRQQRHRHTCELSERAARHRRRRPPRGHAVLQPPVAGRARGPLPGRGRRHRPAGRSIYDIPGRTGRKVDTDAAGPAGQRGAHHRRRQGRRRQPRRDGPGHRRRARRLRGLSAATTP